MTDKKNIVLVGMMGSGKSTIGLILAKKMNFNFFDSDKEIENHEKSSINQIFENKGEKYFRKLEESIILNKLENSQSILSLGGGSFLNKNIRRMVLKENLSFWLNWKYNTLVNRIFLNKKRPLVFGLSKKEIINMIKKRSLFYKQSNYRIDCEKCNKQDIVKKIINIYETKDIKS